MKITPYQQPINSLFSNSLGTVYKIIRTFPKSSNIGNFKLKILSNIANHIIDCEVFVAYDLDNTKFDVYTKGIIDPNNNDVELAFEEDLQGNINVILRQELTGLINYELIGQGLKDTPWKTFNSGDFNTYSTFWGHFAQGSVEGSMVVVKDEISGGGTSLPNNTFTGTFQKDGETTDLQYLRQQLFLNIGKKCWRSSFQWQQTNINISSPSNYYCRICFQ